MHKKPLAAFCALWAAAVLVVGCSGLTEPPEPWPAPIQQQQAETP